MGNVPPRSLQEQAQEALTTGQTNDSVRPVSLADLTLGRENDGSPHVPTLATLASLPEATPSTGGFTWDAPTWLSERIAARPSQEEEEPSIFAKLVQSPSSATDGPPVDPDLDYFSLDDVGMLETAAEPASLITIDTLVAGNREYYSLKEIGRETGVAIPLLAADLELPGASLPVTGAPSLGQPAVSAEEPPTRTMQQPQSGNLSQGRQSMVDASIPVSPAHVSQVPRPLAGDISPVPEHTSHVPLPSEGDVSPPIRMHPPLGDSNPTDGLVRFEQLIQNPAMAALVTTDLEAWIMTQSEAAVRHRARRLLAAAYMKQHRYGAAFRAYWTSVFSM